MEQNTHVDVQCILSELHEETLIADVGEATAVYMHELGNALNNILLDLRLLQRELPEEHKQRLAESCNIVVDTAKQMQQVAQYRQGSRVQQYPVDLCKLISELVSENNRVHYSAPDFPVRILATISGTKRVIRLLLENLVKSLSPENSLDIVLDVENESAILQLFSPESEIDDDSLLSLFNAFPIRESPCHSLELAVCKNLIRKMNGSIDIQKNEPDGVMIRVSFALASPN